MRFIAQVVFSVVQYYFQQLRWRLTPKVAVHVVWPVGEVMISPGYCVGSADPNDHYRPWLEANVGRQFVDWDWHLGLDHEFDEDWVTITVSWRHRQKASMIGLMWG